MRVQAYTAYPVTFIITVATPRSEPAPSTHFFAASIHEDYSATVGALLREWKHIGTTALAYPAEKQLQTYFPTHGGAPLYAIRQLMPAGVLRDIDLDFQLEIMRIRYEALINLLPAAFLAGEIESEALSRNTQNAVKKLFQAQNIPDVFIPGDGNPRLGDRTDIDIIAEVGPGAGRTGVEIPAPTS